MRVIRTRTVQPDTSPGVVAAGCLLVGIISMNWLSWWSLLLVLMVPPIVNKLLVGKTHRKEITIEKEM